MKLFCNDNNLAYGVIGTKTPLTDKNGNSLCVGDVVILRSKTSTWNKLRFVAYDYQTKTYYIMGNFLNSCNYDFELAISHEKLSEGFGIGNVYYTR